MASFASPRNHLRITLLSLIAFYFTFSPYFSDKLVASSYVNASSWDAPVVDDLETVMSSHFLLYIAVVLFGLATGDNMLQVTSALASAVQLLSGIVHLSTVNSAAAGFIPWSQMAFTTFVPSVVLGLFGAYSLFLARPKHIFGDASSEESDGFLNVAFFLYIGIVAVKVGSALLYFDNWVSTLSADARAGFKSVLAQELAEFVLIHYVFRLVFLLVLWRTANRGQRSLLGGIAMLGVFYSFHFGHYYHLLRDSDATRIVLLLALAYGIRRNVGTDGPSISLDPRHFLQSLSPRNVLWLLVVFETYMMAASGGQQFESFVENFWPAKAGVFLMPNGLFFLNPLHHLFSILTVVGWIVFVYADEAAVRVALAARALNIVVGDSYLLLSKSEFGFSNETLYPVLIVDLFSLLIAVKALRDALKADGVSTSEWIRSIFHWSYSPIKGGLYLNIIGMLFGSLSLAFAKYHPAGAIFVKDPAFVLCSFYALVMLLAAVNFYIIVRTADRNLSRLIAYVFVFYTLADFFVGSKSALATDLDDSRAVLEVVVHVFFVFGTLSSIYHDYWHPNGGHSAAAAAAPKSPATPRRGRRKVE